MLDLYLIIAIRHHIQVRGRRARFRQLNSVGNRCAGWSTLRLLVGTERSNDGMKNATRKAAVGEDMFRMTIRWIE
jgi:hypothetical protein